MKNKVALITGITVRTERISRVLLKKGYTVHGIKRRASSFNTQRVDTSMWTARGTPEVLHALRRPDRRNEPHTDHPGDKAG